MTPWRVVWSSTAREQAIEAQAWWAEHREDAPSLLLDELFDIVALLERQPHLGLPYVHPRAAGLRRMLLARSRYQLFYGLAEQTREIELVALWHGAREPRPPIDR